MTRPLRIAILTHSTNPRGGVVHALELADALVRLGHAPVVHAPALPGTGFFRPTLCGTVVVPALPIEGDVAGMVEARISDYLAHFAVPTHRRFDLFHAQDGISGNALATLKARGLIAGFARTVHHVDAFEDPRLAGLQARSITAADRHFVVSRTWCDRLAADFGVAAVPVGNGVDAARYAGVPEERRGELARRLGLGPGPVFLSVGGIEERKNSLRTLEAFVRLRRHRPTAQWLIAGGASVLDHRAYQALFDAALAASGLPAEAVLRTGPVAQDDMPALYRLADALVFPSVKEGFGLVVLEAMAGGLPVVTARMAPFTECLEAEDAAWCDPWDPASIAGAMAAVLDRDLHAGLAARGPGVAARHDWAAVARAHLAVYRELEVAHA